MLIDVITIFPEMVAVPLQQSILKRAADKGLLEVRVHNLRDFTQDKHQTVDDYPYGGGAGMLMKPEPIFRAVNSLRQDKTKVILMCPQGEVFSQPKARALAHEEHLLFICGHYEGVDERVRDYLVDEEISIGDYVLTGGELPALVVIDSLSRMIPGVVKEIDSVIQDSFYNGLLDYPQYTRPAEFSGYKVPEVLLSGHHENIALWRRKEALRRTFLKRPDLLEQKELSQEEIRLCQEIKKELKKG
ncbi:MAG: tRNA (guanosine(37)-N1)-methyltransferase TrmD [bacterium]